MPYEHRYPVNYPLTARPRGLGYTDAGAMLSGMGTWVFDTEYGRGNSFQPGHPQPFPHAAYPTSYPRAQAARVLGQSSASPVVGRPFAATRLPTVAHPVRRTPITAAGASLRNPGVAGVDGAGDTLIALGEALKMPSVFGTALASVAVGLGARAAGLTGTTRNVAGIASLGLMGLSAWNLWRNMRELQHEVETAGAAEAGARVGASVSAVAKTVVAAGGAMTDAERRQVLASFSCYENARRTDTWWGRLRGTARDPLKTCGLTAEQAAAVVAAFNTIAKTERVRLMPATFGPGGALEDLGR